MAYRNAQSCVTVCVLTSDVTPGAETVGAKTEKQRTRLDFTVTAIDDVSLSYQLSTLHTSQSTHTQHTASHE